MKLTRSVGSSFVFIALAAISCSAFAADVQSHIKNFHQVTEGVYRGARPLEQGMSELSALGVKTVIDLQGGDAAVLRFPSVIRWLEPGELPESIQEEERLAKAAGQTFLNFPISSITKVTPEEEVEIEQALLVMADPSSQPVYIHCEHGNDRTGLLVALFRVRHQGWSPEAAHKEMVAMGHNGYIGPWLTRAMDDYFYKSVGSK